MTETILLLWLGSGALLGGFWFWYLKFETLGHLLAWTMIGAVLGFLMVLASVSVVVGTLLFISLRYLLSFEFLNINIRNRTE